jgi:4-hydroxy 2-oxovalerate aldolase
MSAPPVPLFETPVVEVLDATLREGSYAVNFHLDERFVAALLGHLDATPIQKIEIGHGIGYEAERAGITPCNIDLDRWCEIARSALTSSSWGMFAQPEFSRLSTLTELCDQGMSFVRLGMEAHQVPNNLYYIERAVEICDQVYLNLMKSSATPASELPRLLSGVTPAIAGLYIVDSYGSMLPGDVKEYVKVAKELFPVVGFHGHDNLGLANANSMAALEAGAVIVDGTLDGIGRGAGNAETESLAGILSIVGEDKYSYQALARLAGFCRTNLDVLPENRNLQVLGGVIGVHSGFFPLIEQICTEHDLEPAILMETAAELARQSVRKNDIREAANRIVHSVEAVMRPLDPSIAGGAR